MRRPVLSERALIGLVGAVQFVGVLDFMMVMPLGPDFARDLGIPSDHIGWIGGAYTAAAAVAGLAGGALLDRFDRRRALVMCMAGLSIGTLAASFATGMTSLIAARLFAGMFGGPASSVAMSIVGDAVPEGRRGRALGAVMGAFSAASVLGLPAGLEMAEVGGWRTPFVAVAGLGAIVTLAALWLLPPLRAHLDVRHDAPTLTRMRELVSRREVVLAYTLTVLIMVGHFAVIPNLSAFLQFNQGYPREQLSWLYFAGGVASFAVMRYAGRLVDRFGAARVALVGIAMTFAVLQAWFLTYAAWLGVLGLFVAYMAVTSVRGVAYQTLTMRVPFASERAGYMSVQSAVAHAAAGGGAMLSSVILSPRPDGGLVGMERIALLAMATCVVMPVFFYKIEAVLARRSQPAPSVASAEQPIES